MHGLLNTVPQIWVCFLYGIRKERSHYAAVVMTSAFNQYSCTFCTYILEVPRSDLGQDTGYRRTDCRLVPPDECRVITVSFKILTYSLFIIIFLLNWTLHNPRSWSTKNCAPSVHEYTYHPTYNITGQPELDEQPVANSGTQTYQH
jgi:hypothetical protein